MENSSPAAPLRVVIISQGLGRIEPPRAQGSIATWSFETARHLARTFNLLLVEFGKHALKVERLSYEGASYVYVPDLINRVINGVHRRFSKLTRLFKSKKSRLARPEYASTCHNLGYILQAAWFARKYRADVIHIHNFSQFVPLVRFFNPSARIVLHMNCEWLSQHDPKMIGPRLRRADAIVCCSGHIRRRFLAAFPQYLDRAHVVYNGSNVERFLPSRNVGAKHPDDPIRILFVGRISPEKGVHLLVDAFAKIAGAYPSASLELIGGFGSLPKEYLVGVSDDPLVRKLERFYECDYAAEVKRRIPSALQGRVVFHGSQTHDQLALHLQTATMMVSPSYSDAFPLTVVEAMAAALPVVGTTVGGIPEAILHEQTGLLVPPDDSDALAGALERMILDPSLRLRMSKAARERALKSFSWHAISEQAARVYAGESVSNPAEFSPSTVPQTITSQ